jgi:hypothetical protein
MTSIEPDALMTSRFESPGLPVHLPVSSAEAAMWQAEHGAASLAFLECPRHLALAVRVTGRLDVPALHHTLREIARRHDVLRSRFVERDGQLTRVASQHADVALTVTPAAASTAAAVPSSDQIPDGQRALEQDLVREEVNAPFELRVGGLIRARIFTFSASHSLLVVTVHHIVADGWSLRLLARELRTGYQGQVLGHPASWPSLSAAYADYVAWQQQRLRSDAAQQLAAEWAGQTAARQATVIPGDLTVRDPAATRGGRQSFAISADLIDGLRRLAAEHKTTVGIAALSSFIALVAEASGRNHVVVGVPVWDRGRPAFEDVIGLFMNALPLYVTAPARPTTIDVLAETRDAFRRLSRYSSLPYSWLRGQQIHRGEHAADPFRIVFNFAAIDGVGIDLHGVRSEHIDVFADTPAVADISLHIFARGESFTGLFLYKEELYSPAFIASLAARYTRLLADCCART